MACCCPAVRPSRSATTLTLSPSCVKRMTPWQLLPEAADRTAIAIVGTTGAGIAFMSWAGCWAKLDAQGTTAQSAQIEATRASDTLCIELLLAQALDPRTMRAVRAGAHTRARRFARESAAGGSLAQARLGR